MATKPTSRQRTKNMMLQGQGASTAQDRGANQTAALGSAHPWDCMAYLQRWMEYVRWYMKAWEARKIIDIPVQDAWRIPFKITGLDDADADAMMKEWKRLQAEKKFRRAGQQERLLGGCCLYMGLADADAQNPATTEQPINPAALTGGADRFRCINVVDCNRISRGDINNNPLDENYDLVEHYLIDGHKVHHSRLVVFDGSPMFNRQNMMVLAQARGFNPAGFGESILTPLYDDLVRATGAREGAYHLINLASVIMATCKDFKTLKTTKPGEQALSKLAEMVQSMSMYRGILLDGTDAEINQHSASFGSVPELVMSFLVVLSAGCDIPATRFLGQAPGGLNASGESDLENYYNTIGHHQSNTLKPAIMKPLELIGTCLFGFDRWSLMRTKMDLEFPQLWNQDGKEEADTANTWITAYKALYEMGMTVEQISAELNARNIFLTPVELEELMQAPPEEPPIDANGEIGKLAAGDDDTDGPDKNGKPPFGRTQVKNADWKEADHPRADDGKFGEGAGSAGAAPTKEGEKENDPAVAQYKSAYSAISGIGNYQGPHEWKPGEKREGVFISHDQPIKGTGWRDEDNTVHIETADGTKTFDKNEMWLIRYFKPDEWEKKQEYARATAELQKHYQDNGMVGNNNFRDPLLPEPMFHALAKAHAEHGAVWERSDRSEAVYIRFNSDNGTRQQVRYATHSPVYGASSIGEQADTVESMEAAIAQLAKNPKTYAIPGTEDQLAAAAKLHASEADGYRVKAAATSGYIPMPTRPYLPMGQSGVERAKKLIGLESADLGTMKINELRGMMKRVGLEGSFSTKAKLIDALGPAIKSRADDCREYLKEMESTDAK